MKSRQKNRKIIALSLAIILLISVGYAAISTNLKINGTANIAATSWSVYFKNVVVNPNNNVASVTTEPTVPDGSTNTTEINWEVSMDMPGQIYEFTVDVVNAGTIDAMIETATNSIVTSALTEDQAKYLDYSITYVNGVAIEQYDKLSSGETKTIKVKLQFKQDINPEDLPSQDQTGISLSYETNYVQADNNALEKRTSLLSIGDTVDYSTTLNGVDLNNWKVFYVNGNYTYIITEDYLPNEAIASNEIDKGGLYNIYSNDSRQKILDTIVTKSNWDELLTGTLNGTKTINETRTEDVWAMGAPTLELYVNSWNTTYPGDKLYYRTTTTPQSDGYYGYYIGTTENPSTTDAHMSSTEGYGNTLYYPRQVSIDNCYGYCLATASSMNDCLMGVDHQGNVSYANYLMKSYAARPVICFPTNLIN